MEHARQRGHSHGRHARKALARKARPDGGSHRNGAQRRLSFHVLRRRELSDGRPHFWPTLYPDGLGRQCGAISESTLGDEKTVHLEKIAHDFDYDGCWSNGG